MPFTSAFHTYTSSDTVTNTNLNGNINQIITQGNAIDNTYVNNATGFYASQIIPTSTPQGTFGGSVQLTLPLGGIVGTTNNAVVPLTVTGNTGGGQTAHLLDVLLQPAGTNMFSVDNAGNGVFGGSLQASPTINATSIASYVPPGYTNTGAVLASTWHYVTGVTGSIGASGTATINLTFNAVFTSATTYSVGFSYADANSIATVATVQNVSGTQFTIKNNDGVSAHTFAWVASGT
jgi:hypothetical protein